MSESFPSIAMKGSRHTIFLLTSAVFAGIHNTKPYGLKYAGTNPDYTWYLELVDDSYT